MGSRSVICAYHLMFLSMWHLFGLNPGKPVPLHRRQRIQQPDCSRQDVETGGEKLIIWVLSHSPQGLDLGELFLVDCRGGKKKV